LPSDFNPRGGGARGADGIFPLFMKQVLPPGLAGAVLAAGLSAPPSAGGSGINAVATGFTVGRGRSAHRANSHVGKARWVTFATGMGITAIAYVLDPLTRSENIVGMMSRTFNVFVAPMGGMVLVGIFLPFVGPWAVIVAALSGLVASVLMSLSW